jgi:hypothetical protein
MAHRGLGTEVPFLNIRPARLVPPLDWSPLIQPSEFDLRFPEPEALADFCTSKEIG